MNKKLIYIVAISEYDECGSGLNMCNAEFFDDPEKAAQFVSDDIECSKSGYDDDDEDEEDDEYPTYKEIHKAIKDLKAEGDCEFETPEGAPVWVKWAVYARKGPYNG